MKTQPLGGLPIRIAAATDATVAQLLLQHAQETLWGATDQTKGLPLHEAVRSCFVRPVFALSRCNARVYPGLERGRERDGCRCVVSSRHDGCQPGGTRRRRIHSTESCLTSTGPELPSGNRGA